MKPSRLRSVLSRPAAALAAALPVALLLFAVALSGCDRDTCTGACTQYYGGSDGDCGRQSVLSDGTSPDQALDRCVKDCREALYTTSGTELSGVDSGGYARLENEADAIEFIRCIVDKDYSAEAFNQACADLFYDCRWIKW